MNCQEKVFHDEIISKLKLRNVQRIIIPYFIMGAGCNALFNGDICIYCASVFMNWSCRSNVSLVNFSSITI